jgi:putative transposase
MSVARSTLRYESSLIKRDAPVVAAMRELSARYPRYGYRRIQVFLDRQGYAMSPEKAASQTHRHESASTATSAWRQARLGL